MSWSYSPAPLEEVLLAAISELGQGATEMQVWRKAEELAERDRIALITFRDCWTEADVVFPDVRHR